MQPLGANLLMQASVSKRSQLVLKQVRLIQVPTNINSDLHRAYQISNVLTPVLPQFIQKQINVNRSVLEIRRQNKAISSICRQFANTFIESIPQSIKSPSQMKLSPRNLYEMSGAVIFTQSNSISRSLSTKMGNLWEKIAKISPYAISPEEDFGVKITGIDLVILPYGKGCPVFVQIKTQRSTLTGSQVPRSRSELEIHQQQLFAAAFCTGDNWTFSSPNISRVCGEEFWNQIGLNYDLIEFHVKRIILKIQSAYLQHQKEK